MAEDTFGVICSAFMEAVHVELSDERVHFAVSEVSGEYDGLELVDIFDDKFCSRRGPECNFSKLLILYKRGCTLRI